MEGSIERRTIAMGKLTVQEVAKILVEKNGLEAKEANRFATEFFGVILQRLQQGDSVKVKGLGTFKITNVEARESVSVRTGERVVIDSHSKVTFIPDTVMKELVNKPFSQFETVVLNDGVEFEDMKDESTENESQPEEEQPVVEAQLSAVEEQPVVEEQLSDVEEQTVVEEQLSDVEEQTVVEEEEEPQPVVEEPQPVVEKPQPMAVSNFSDDNQPTDDQRTPLGRWILTAIGILLLMAFSFLGGYEFGRRQHPALADTLAVHDTIYMAEMDSISIVEEPAPVVEAPKAEPVVETPKPQPVVEAPKPKPAEEVLDKWSAKDERVRLGAYRIVGTAEEVTVLAGQTFYSICRAHLGPDMQCYVEVYNNLPSSPKVKEGQVIKIPKLELKKRKK